MASAYWSVPALADEVIGIRREALQFARGHGVPAHRLADLRLAISETVSNAVIHAFRTRDYPGTVTLSIHIEPERFAEVVVRDAVRAGTRPCLRIGRHIRFTRQMLEDWRRGRVA